MDCSPRGSRLGLGLHDVALRRKLTAEITYTACSQPIDDNEELRFLQSAKPILLACRQSTEVTGESLQLLSHPLLFHFNLFPFTRQLRHLSQIGIPRKVICNVTGNPLRQVKEFVAWNWQDTV